MASANPVELADSNNQFTKAIYAHLQGKPGNLFFSPISIQAVLAMVQAGAKGTTRSQLVSGAVLKDDPSANAEMFRTLNENIAKANNDVTLSFVNGMYSDKKFTLKPNFLSVINDQYHAEVGKVDFGNNVEAAKTINGWVSEKTKNKISELFKESDFTPATALVLLNAIYFKGDWADKFPVASTKKDVFHISSKETQMVDMMTVQANFRVVQLDDCTVIELPYKGQSVSMILIVPKEIEGLAAIEKKYVGTDIRKLLEGTRKREVRLTMPKFKIEQTLELEDILQKLGISHLFDEQKCDLSDMSDKPLVASKAIQKAFIEVNEEGAEAAAATGLKIAMRMMPLPPRDLAVDRPFLLSVNSDLLPIFFGRIVKIPS